MYCYPSPINNPCPSYPNTGCVVYTGANLQCSGIQTNDRLTVILSKLDSKLCQLSPPPGNDLVYHGTDFNTPTTCPDSYLNGKRFRLFFRGMSSFMIKAVEWDYLSGGGFQILLSGFQIDPSDIFFVQFY